MLMIIKHIFIISTPTYLAHKEEMLSEEAIENYIGASFITTYLATAFTINTLK